MWKIKRPLQWIWIEKYSEIQWYRRVLLLFFRWNSSFVEWVSVYSDMIVFILELFISVTFHGYLPLTKLPPTNKKKNNLMCAVFVFKWMVCVIAIKCESEWRFEEKTEDMNNNILSIWLWYKFHVGHAIFILIFLCLLANGASFHDCYGSLSNSDKKLILISSHIFVWIK